MRKRVLTITVDQSPITRQEVMSIHLDGCTDPLQQPFEVMLLANAAIDQTVRQLSQEVRENAARTPAISVIDTTKLN